MNQTETAKLLTIIQRSYPNHFKDFDPDSFKIQERMWHNALFDYSYQECVTAFEMWFNTAVFPPVPANLKPLLLKITNPQSLISGEKAWEIVDHAVRRYGSYGQSKAFNTFSEPIKRAVRNVGGWQKICETQLGQPWDFLRKNFIESFNDIDQERVEQEMLPSPVLDRIQGMWKQKQLEQANQAKLGTHK
jgi:Loader and inhibitor of phage G40P